jgi:L-lactate utilization protein LutB
MTKSHNKDHTLYIDPSIKDPKPLMQELEIEFEKFWEMYEKKNDRKKAFQKWKKLKQEDKEKIFKTLPDYVKSTPDIKFRKNPVTYLNNESWNDDIVYPSNTTRETKKSNSLFDCL